MWKTHTPCWCAFFRTKKRQTRERRRRKGNKRPYGVLADAVDVVVVLLHVAPVVDAPTQGRGVGRERVREGNRTTTSQMPLPHHPPHWQRTQEQRRRRSGWSDRSRRQYLGGNDGKRSESWQSLSQTKAPRQGRQQQQEVVPMPLVMPTTA